MEIIYTGEEIPEVIKKSLFLAGPSLRPGQEKELTSWREGAINILRDKGYDGVIFCPENRDMISNENFDYNEQVKWEDKCLNIADCIVFWIPRDLKNLPAFTTNDEYGYWKGSGKVVLGCPADAEKTSYQEFYAKEFNIPFSKTLADTMQDAIDKIGDGAERSGGERFVPLFVWKTETFQQWYKSQTNAKNRLDWARVLYSFRPNNGDFVFMWILKVHVYISEENRVKTNEFVLSRTNISSVVMWHREKHLENSKIILIREFRSPAVTKDGFVIENVGGSSHNSLNNEKIIIQEIKEETGFDINIEKLKPVGSRQISGTLSAHKSFVFSYELSREELEYFVSRINESYGNENDTEITYIKVFSLSNILSADIDWATLGQIYSVMYDAGWFNSL